MRAVSFKSETKFGQKHRLLKLGDFGFSKLPFWRI